MSEVSLMKDNARSVFEEVYPVVCDFFGLESEDESLFTFITEEEVREEGMPLPAEFDLYFDGGDTFVVNEHPFKKIPYASLGHEAGHVCRSRFHMDDNIWFKSVAEFFAELAERHVAERYNEEVRRVKITDLGHFKLPGKDEYNYSCVQKFSSCKS